jgi:malate dehydrogenase (oxaloacetate-decarboxylating)
MQTRQTELTGANLLGNALLNKGTAFSDDEREDFKLTGLLAPHVDTLETQESRAYQAYLSKESEIEKHIYLRALQDQNEVLFYALLKGHIEEMMPIIYTPVVGTACQTFSHIYRTRRGLFIPFPQKDKIAEILDNSPIEDPKVIVVTDGERILGLGDQGVGGMGIPIGKLSLYTLCGGIDPANTLPILLDVGTDNKDLHSDPLYLGWRHERVRGQDYDDFIEAFVTGVMKKFPNVMLQFEDFANQNARRLLEKYHDRLCTFNDDIQGTASVAVAAVIAATNATKTKLRDQNVVMFGAGSAGLGIAELIAQAMIDEGATEKEANDHIWLVDRPGLLHDGLKDIQPAQKRFVKPLKKLVEDFAVKEENIWLADAVRISKATVLIGTSAQAGAFKEGVIRDMAKHTARPIVLPLSNPTIKAEATPNDIFAWTDGKALVATGSPFTPVKWKNDTIQIGQCNNSYIFPGIGLGVVASGATRVTNNMFMAAAKTLAQQSPAIVDTTEGLFPHLNNIREVSLQIAMAVAEAAQKSGHAPAISQTELEKVVRATMWQPEYPRLVAKKLAAV